MAAAEGSRQSQDGDVEEPTWSEQVRGSPATAASSVGFRESGISRLGLPSIFMRPFKEAVSRVLTSVGVGVVLRTGFLGLLAATWLCARSFRQSISYTKILNTGGTWDFLSYLDAIRPYLHDGMDFPSIRLGTTYLYVILIKRYVEQKNYSQSKDKVLQVTCILYI